VDLGTRKGDCEDFARVLAMILRRKGIPAGCMTLAFGFLPSGEYHAVLWIDTDHGAYVADVNERFVRPWSESPIRRETWNRTQADGMVRPVVG
jgi:predicted transglutaminase-like cysteine proteinase